jgi:hypothetical protein
MDNQVVKIRRNLPDLHIQEGMVGVVVMVYPIRLSPGLPQAYEVEFADEHGVTLALVTLTDVDIESVTTV